MRRSRLLQNLATCLILFTCRIAVAQSAETALSPAETDKPNVIVIFTDDQGYGDVGCYGAQGCKTPHLDRLAREGLRMTDFYVAQAVCSASRAALLTGCYPNRIGISGALGPSARHGIHDDEMTLGELFRQRGYATAAFGKWHLGHHSQFLPTRHGFDEYFGLPYSNDMWPFHPTNRSFPDLPLIKGEEIIAYNPDQTQLTTQYTEHAVDFIERHHDRPFFLYLAHSMPHVPLFVSDKFAGDSEQGLFGDVIEEIDWSVGQILDTLRRREIDGQTLVVFTCDNGPWLSYGDHAGSAGPLREGKGTTFDGGVREPAIFRWPGTIPAGSVCHEMAMTIDLLPTFAEIIDAELPSQRRIDGKSILHLLKAESGARSPHEALFFYWGNHLQAVRSGDWKLHFPHAYRTLAGEPGSGGKPGPYRQAEIELALFNLLDDIGENTDVASEHPEVVQRLQNLADKIRKDLGDSGTGDAGQSRREPGRLPQP